jgi:peptidyl-prolyl cis-trans isomerase A (cyclophilin A)
MLTRGTCRDYLFLFFCATLASSTTTPRQLRRFLLKMCFTKLLVLVTAVAFLTVPAFSQTSSTTTTAKPKSTTTTAKPAYDHALLNPALLKAKAPDTYQVKFETTRGDFTITVTRAWAPLGADRFYNLVKHHYFDNARLFRVVPGFVAQFGLSAYPQVNSAWSKATIKDDPRNQSNKKGTIVFATSGPNTRTTQLFINLRDNGSSLDSQGFTPFGMVDGTGMNVVNMFYDQYGDTAGMDQENITKGGEHYIASKYPKLDTIKFATIVGDAASATPAAKPAAKPTTTPKQ